MPPSLEQRVAALEQAIGDRVVPDTFAPSAGQVIDPQGRVTYDFDGHVHARGLDLDSGTVSTPPDDNKVRWLRLSDGSVAAEIYGFNNPGATGFIVARGRGAGQVAGARLEALDVPGNLLARVEAIRDPLAAGFPEGRVDALVQDDTGAFLRLRTILDGDNKSHFVQTEAGGLGDPVRMHLSPFKTVAVPALAANAGSAAIPGPVMAINGGDGPAGFAFPVGICAGAGVYPLVFAVLANTANNFQHSFVFVNGSGIASAAGTFIFAYLSDRALT